MDLQICLHVGAFVVWLKEYFEGIFGKGRLSYIAILKKIYIVEIVDIEKQIDSYEYGFCGKIDCIVKCLFKENGKMTYE